MQAATCSERWAGPETCNAEADPPPIRGRLPATGKRATRAPVGSAGVVTAACAREGNSSNTGSPGGGVAPAKPASRKGQAGPVRVAERPVLPGKPGNSGGGKGPQARRGEMTMRRMPGVAQPRTPAQCSVALAAPHAEAKRNGHQRAQNGLARWAAAARREQACGRVRSRTGTRRSSAAPEAGEAQSRAPFPTGAARTRGRKA